MKKRKDRWIGVSTEARRAYILARHRLTFPKWCEVVQARINMTRVRKTGKAKSIPKKLKNLPVLPEIQPVSRNKVSIWVRIYNWFIELITPAETLNKIQQEK